MLNMIGLTAMIAVAILLIWSSLRAWRLKNIFLRWSGVALSALLAATLFSLSALAIAGLFKLHMRNAPAQTILVERTPERVLRGQAISDSFCSACHSKTGTLTGGTDIGKHLPIPVGSFIASNLTPAGQLNYWSDGDIFRAIRNGVDPEGHWLMIMSYTSAGKLSDEDTQALIAYIRTRAAAGVDTAYPPDQLNMLGLMMLGGGLLPSGKPVFTGVHKAPPKGPTFRYGEYILSYQDCRQCHGEQLTGGVPGQLGPIGPDLSL